MRARKRGNHHASRTLYWCPRMKGGDMIGTLGMLAQKAGGNNDNIFWIIAAVLVIAGIVALIRGSVAVGAVLIVLGLLVGPGGVSVYN